MERREEIKSIVQTVEQTEHKDKKNVLPNDFAVFVEIYKKTELEHELIYFKKLVQTMNLDKMVISRNVDKLFDLGVIYGDWTYVEKEKTWQRTFHIEPDALKLAKDIYAKQNPSTKNNSFREKEKQSGKNDLKF